MAKIMLEKTFEFSLTQNVSFIVYKEENANLTYFHRKTIKSTTLSEQQVFASKYLKTAFRLLLFENCDCNVFCNNRLHFKRIDNLHKLTY